MYRFFILQLLLLPSVKISAQTSAQIDSLSLELCKTLEATKAMGDSTSLKFTYHKHIPGFISKFPQKTEAEYEALDDLLYFRFQKNCHAFVELLSRTYKPQGDWQKFTEKPKKKLSKKECLAIEQIKHFYYIEAGGSRVNVTIENGQWLEKFADGTFSRLYFRWKDNCEFEIEFIESNNMSRKNFSSKGDKYHYGVYNKTAEGFSVYVVADHGNFIGFTLHITK